MRNPARLARSTALVTLALLLLASSSLRGHGLGADEESALAWLAQGAYERAGEIRSETGVYYAWRGTDAEATANGSASVLVLVFEEEGEVREAYDIVRAPAYEQGVLYTIRRRLYATEPEGARIAEANETVGESTLELGRRLLGQLLEVEPRWLTAVEQLGEAVRLHEEPESTSAREPLRTATRALERAYQAAPWHLGIVRDLLAAYQLLLPYEVGTDRGANISFLWRERCGQWLGGAPNEEERALGLQCQLTCTFAEGCYPLAADLLDDPLLKERTDVEPLRLALAGLGQIKHEVAERVTLSGPRGTLDLQAIGCPGEPRLTGFPWHRRVYLTYAAGSPGPPLPVWFSLSLEGEQGARRWALVGWVGSSRRVLRFYGAQEPDRAAVDTLVTGLIQQTANAPELR